MRLKVDHKNDALYFRVDESAVVQSQEIKPGVILDYDANDNVVGIEILGLSKLVPEELLTRKPRLRDVMAPLSPREMELLRQLGQGRSTKEIAHILGITPQTVKNHITSILRKLDVNDRTQAVLAGLRYGWLSLEESAADGEPVSNSGRF